VVVRSGQTITVRGPIKSFPATLAVGAYLLIAQVSYGAGLVSAATSGPSVELNTPFISLAESFPAIKLPPPAVAGFKINGSIKILITNNGNIPSKGPVIFGLSFSSQPNQVGTSIPSVPRNLMIRAGGSQTVFIPIKSIPMVSPGDYFLVVQVTDPSGGTSIASPEITTTIVAPVISLAAILGPVTNANSGDTITIANNGNVDDVTSFNPTLGFSTDSGGMQPAGGTTVVLAGPLHIKAGKSVKVHLNQWKSLLSGLTAGNFYYLTAMFTDDAGNSAFAVSSTSFQA
jgi:hypothetical protein